MTRIFLFFALIFHITSFASETGFIFFGDAGTGSPTQYEVAKSMNKFCSHSKCDFVNLLGDNFYPSGVQNLNDRLWEQAFELPYALLNIPFYVLLGNHDYKGNVEAQIQYSKKSSKWHMPSRYYTFSKGPVDFFFLDTNQFNKAQRKWLSEALEASKNTWKIVCGHHPVYSYGGHGNSDELQEELLPIIEGKVDFYLAGHDHNKQVIEKKSSSITYIVSGAGSQTDPIKKSRPAIYTSDELGFGHFLISEDRAILTILDRNGNPDYAQTFN